MPTTQERQFLKFAIEEKSEQMAHIRSIVNESDYRLETTKSGQRLLIVTYSGKAWDQAMAAALAACGLSDDQRVQVVAMPAGCAWGSEQ